MLRIVFTLLLAFSLLASCSDAASVRDKVALAETSLAEQDYESSRHLCDDLLGSDRREELSASEYARLSILYMQFYENSDDQEALDQALECYRQAEELNPDSARAVYDSLSLEDHKYAYALSLIADGIDNPKSNTEDHDRYVSPDSVGVVFDSDSL